MPKNNSFVIESFKSHKHDFRADKGKCTVTRSKEAGKDFRKSDTQLIRNVLKKLLRIKS